MRKTAIIVITFMMVGIGFLSGCNNIVEKIEFKIGESVVFENIKYTFLSAYWNDSVYTLKIKGENIANEKESSNVMIIKYEMQNGYTYKPLKVYGVTAVPFNLNPGGNDTQTLIDYSSIDRNFLPVAKIYLIIYYPGGELTLYKNSRAIEINVI